MKVGGEKFRAADAFRYRDGYEGVKGQRSDWSCWLSAEASVQACVSALALTKMRSGVTRQKRRMDEEMYSRKERK